MTSCAGVQGSTRLQMFRASLTAPAFAATAFAPTPLADPSPLTDTANCNVQFDEE